MGDITWRDFTRQIRKTSTGKKGHNWYANPTIREISSGAIVPSDIPGVYEIQANTMNGLCNFHAFEDTPLDIQSDNKIEVASVNSDLVSHFLSHWVTFKKKLLDDTDHYPRSRPVMSRPVSRKVKLSSRTESKVETTPESILESLRNPDVSSSDRRKYVLHAEIQTFEGSQRTEICSILRNFILQHRNSNAPQDLIAVGSAIRKLVAYLSTEELGTLNELLASNARLPVSLDVELEVAKTIVRKLTSNPPKDDDSEPELADRLMDIANTYLNPRLLPREKHGAVAMNATLSLLLLRSQHVSAVISHFEALSAHWFRQLACRRTSRLLADLKRRLSAQVLPTATRSLVEFSERLCG